MSVHIESSTVEEDDAVRASLPAKIRLKVPTKINVGSSHRKQAGFINIDIDPESQPDIICDISKGIPLPSRSAELIVANHILEHLNEDAWQEKFDMSRALLEFSRILTDDGVVEIEVPSPQGEDAVRIQHYTIYGWQRLRRIFSFYFESVHCRGTGTWVQARGVWPLFALLGRVDPFWGNVYRFKLRKPIRRNEIVIYDRE